LPQSKWANPFVVGFHGTRDEVIAYYREWVKSKPELMNSLHELYGKTLGCWCAPNNDCHGKVLSELVQKHVQVENGEVVSWDFFERVNNVQNND
jgi:hypothetical protein